MGKNKLINRIRHFYGISDEQPEFQWTRTDIYQRRVEQVKTGWIVSGLIMLALGSTEGVFILTAFTGFMSLAFLEHDDDR